MPKEKYLVIKYENEFFTKQVSMNYNELRQAIDSEFPGSSYFIMSDSFLYQIGKGHEKIFGKNSNKLDVDIALYYLHDKYLDFFEQFKILTNNFDGIFYDEDMYGKNASIEVYNENIEDLKIGLKKPIVVDKWKYKLRQDNISEAVNLDPSNNQKYVNWILTMDYNFGYNYLEDRDKLNALLTDFDKSQVKALIKNAGHSIDIMDYSKDSDLWTVVSECYYDKLEDLEANDRNVLIQKRKVFEDRNWIIVSPTNHQEAVTLGRRTNWCTSADSEDGEENYNNYTVDEYDNFYPLYMFFDKIEGPNSKFLYQWSSNPYMEDFLDQADQEFDVLNVFLISFIEDYADNSNLPVPSKFKAFLGEHDKEKYEEFYYLNSISEAEKFEYIRNGINIEIFLKSNDMDILNHVAQNGYGLDVLINNENWEVRETVAENEFGLDILVEDHHWRVRKEVASKGYGLDKLIFDIESDAVNLMVISKGYELNEYLNCKNKKYVFEAQKYQKIIDERNLEPFINKFGHEVYFE